MLSVKEICEIAEVTRKTLFHYDRIGLLKPTRRKGNQGIKLYDRNALDRLLEIRLYRTIGIPIEDIRDILEGGPACRKLILARTLETINAEILLQKERKAMAAALEQIDDETLADVIHDSSDMSDLINSILCRTTEETI